MSKQLIRHHPAGLYPRNGLYCYLDHPCYRAVVSGYRRWGGISRILATEDVKTSSNFILTLTNLFSYDVNTNYGTAADLLALSEALHARDMYLMVDVVANHMASPPLLGITMIFSNTTYRDMMESAVVWTTACLIHLTRPLTSILTVSSATMTTRPMSRTAGLVTPQSPSQISTLSWLPLRQSGMTGLLIWSRTIQVSTLMLQK